MSTNPTVTVAGLLITALILFSFASTAYLMVSTYVLYQQAGCYVPPPEKSIAELRVPFKGTLP